MKKCYLILLLLFVFAGARSQNVYSDTIYYENGSIGSVSVSHFNHKKRLLSIREKAGDSKKVISFNEVRSVDLSNGRYYVKKTVHGKPKLLVIFIRSNYNLLFDDHDGIFYIENQDSLLFISKHHISRALPLIFGKENMELFYKTYGKTESYTQQYFSKVLTFVNAMSNDIQENHVQNIDQFKTRISVGLFLAFTSSRLWLQLIDDPTKQPAYIRTKNYHNSLTPFGISFAASITPRWHMQMASYYYNMLLKDFYYKWGSYETIDIPFSILQNYDPVPRTSNYSFTSYNSDLSLMCLLVNPAKHKVQPFIFAGPTIGVLKDHQMEISILYNQANRTSSCDFWYKSHTKELMVALNCGVGVSGYFGKHFIVNTFGKYQGGVYPKALLTPDLVRAENNTPYDHSHFNELHFIIEHRFDQISRMLSFGGSVQFRF